MGHSVVWAPGRQHVRRACFPQVLSGYNRKSELKAAALKKDNLAQSENPATLNPCLPSESTDIEQVNNELDSRVLDVATDDVIVLLLAIATGITTGFGVVLFNDFVAFIQNDVVWSSAPRLAAFGPQGLVHDPKFASWRCLLLPQIVGGAAVAALRHLAGGFDGDAKSVQAEKLKPGMHSANSLPAQLHLAENLQRGALLPISDNEKHAISAAKKKLYWSLDIFEPVMDRLQNIIRTVQRRGIRDIARPYIKLVAAGMTLGSGASLGPEGPSVELGKANATRVTCAARDQRANIVTDLMAAGAGAGVSAGFGAPMSGVIFSVETVLLRAGLSTAQGKKEEDTGVVIASVLVACVAASVISEAGLGLEPAFQVPPTAPLSVPELPMCIIAGLLCGCAAAVLSFASDQTEKSFCWLRDGGVPRSAIPVLGGLACGSLAVLFPEITYQGFDNLNALFQFDTRQTVQWTSSGLATVVIVKITATALCRSSGLVGGVYAPSLFIGASLGALFWRIADDVTDVVVSLVPYSPLVDAVNSVQLASVNTYALISAAAMLAAFCQVPLTSVLLLFELTQDYSLILPTLVAVGFARWGAAMASRMAR